MRRVGELLEKADECQQTGIEEAGFVMEGVSRQLFPLESSVCYLYGVCVFVAAGCCSVLVKVNAMVGRK